MIISTDLSFPVLETEKNVFIIIFIYLFFNTLYYTLCQIIVVFVLVAFG